MPDLKVLVVQMGARHRYEYARMLLERNALAALYTDAAWPGEGPSLSRSLIAFLAPRYIGALSRRTVDGVPARMLRSTLLPNIVGGVLQACSIEAELRYRIEDRTLGSRAGSWGFAGANVVLTTDGNGGDAFLTAARERGLKIAADIVLTPTALEILAEEHHRWPGWEPSRDINNAIRTQRRHMERVVAVADLLLYPSRSVLLGLEAVAGFDPAKAAQVPYSSGTITVRQPRPERKRVLFAGNAALRKGLPYLAEAARLLRNRDPEVAVVVAGYAGGVADRPETDCLHFLGRLGPDDMAAEFARADIFCLPSLAEGSATVVLEALAYGLPSIVTVSTGSPVTDGVDGFVVPERDSVAIAEAILTLVNDRALRATMSDAALKTSARLSQANWGNTLHHTLAGLVPTGASLPFPTTRLD